MAGTPGRTSLPRQPSSRRVRPAVAALQLARSTYAGAASDHVLQHGVNDEGVALVDDAGVPVRPAKKEDLVGELNKGWTVAKRLLQYERSGIGDAPDRPKAAKRLNAYASLAMDYVGERNGQIADPALRDRITRHVIQEKSLALTGRRVTEESKTTGAPGRTSWAKAMPASASARI